MRSDDCSSIPIRTPMNDALLMRHLNTLLGDPDSRKIVRVDPSGWALVDYLSTGRLRAVSCRIGGAEYVMDVPEREPHVVAEAGTLRDLVALMGYPGNREREDYLVQRTQIDSRDCEALEQIAPLIEEALLSAAREAQPLDPSGRRACQNCRGQGGGTLANCPCRDNGRHYLGVARDAEDTIAEQPSEPVVEAATGSPVYDPDCPDCSGTGRRRWTCPGCGGGGEEPVCLDWHVVGPSGSLSIRLDVAALLRAGDATVVVRSDPGYRFLRVITGISLAPLIQRINEAVAEGQPTWVFHGRHHRQWNTSISGPMMEFDVVPTGEVVCEEEMLLPEHGPFRYCWREHPDLSLQDWATALPNGNEILDSLQAQLSGNTYAYSRDEGAYERASDGCVEAIHYTAVRELPAHVLLDALLAKATEHGFGLGLGYGFIATGQSGPQVYLTDGEQPIKELGLDYTWQGALADALHRLPEVMQRRPGGTET